MYGNVQCQASHKRIIRTRMDIPEKPYDEALRLDTLRALNVLDTAPEERFDRLTRLAKRLFRVPIALIGLVDADRVWFKSAQGLNETETPRDHSFCAHVILRDNILIVPDTAQDERFRDNSLISHDPKIRFYAGCPLIADNGSKLGALCLLDRKPRKFDESDQVLLRDLANLVEKELVAVQSATLDELTMLSNRHGFEVLSQRALGVCKRMDRPVCLLFFDLRNFRQLNEQYGVAAGDRALTEFSHMLTEVFRESDVIGRLGGDEFVVLLTNTAKPRSREVLARLNTAVDDYNHHSNMAYELSFSVDVVEYDAEMHHSIGELLQEAGTLMYQHKRQSAGGRDARVS